MKLIGNLSRPWRQAVLLATCAVAAGAAGAGEAAQRNVSAIRTALNASVRFASGEAQLDDAAIRYVAALGVALANSAPGPIVVSGYTDAKGTGEFNLVLSRLRAEAVKHVLTEAGVDPARIEIEANGEWFAQGIPDEPDALAAQRRVLIHAEYLS